MSKGFIWTTDLLINLHALESIAILYVPRNQLLRKVETYILGDCIPHNFGSCYFMYK